MYYLLVRLTVSCKIPLEKLYRVIIPNVEYYSIIPVGCFCTANILVWFKLVTKLAITCYW